MRLNKICLGVTEAFFIPQQKERGELEGRTKKKKNFLNTNQKDLSVRCKRRQQRRGGENKYDGSEKSLKMLYKARNIPLLDKSPPINRLPMPIS